MNTANSHSIATLGGGCFWCLEAVFSELKGMIKVESGYAGGHKDNPSYEDVCTGRTGHAEVVQLTFDPSVVSYKELLELFFFIHDPTTLNRQGNDVGTQYRSIILYHSDEQKETALDVISDIQKKGIWEDKIVTEIVPLGQFFVAEEYHQNYYQNNPNQGYCRAIIAPKVTKFRKKYFEQLKK